MFIDVIIIIICIIIIISSSSSGSGSSSSSRRGGQLPVASERQGSAPTWMSTSRLLNRNNMQVGSSNKSHASRSRLCNYSKEQVGKYIYSKQLRFMQVGS